MTNRRFAKEPRRFWSHQEREILRARYPHEKTEGIARDLGRPLPAVFAMAAQLGLKKTPEYLETPDACRLRRDSTAGAATRFQSGHRPWNTGTHYVAGGRSAETRFKKGQHPHTWKPLGSTRICDGYLQRKVTDTGYPPRDWVPVHRLVWIAANGPIPPGYAVAFRAGRATTIEAEITLDALELVSRRELMQRNTVHNLPKELAQVVQLRGTGQRVGDVLKIHRSDLTEDGIRFVQQKTGSKLVVRWTPALRAAVERAKGLGGNVHALTLFSNRKGKAPDYRTVGKQWADACRAAEVTDARLHDLRALAITQTRREGKNPTALAGHSTQAQTVRYLRDRDEPVVDGPEY